MLQGAHIYVIGRLNGVHLDVLLAREGATRCSRPSARVTHTVVAHSAAPKFDGRTRGQPVSEFTFKRMVGLLPPPENVGPGFSKDDVCRVSGLSPELVDNLILFDILDPHQDVFSFHDMASARTVARLLREGVTERSVLTAGSRLRSMGMRISEARLEAVRDTLKRAYGDCFMTLDGQIELPLPTEEVDPDEMFERALVLEAIGLHEEAEAIHRSLCSVCPRDERFPFALGNILAVMGRFDEAIVAHLEANRRDRTFADPIFNIGTIYEARGAPQDAEKAYTMALGIDPEHVDARFNLAVLLTSAGRYAEALPHWELLMGGKGEDKAVARRAALLCRVAINQS
jgi:FOG: TPR repeat